MVTLRPKEQHVAMHTAQQRQTTEEFKEEYAWRAGVEGTLSQGIGAFDLRRARYIGLARTHVQHVATAAAINVHRLADWWSETPRAHTRRSAFASLAVVA
jgi:transposase